MIYAQLVKQLSLNCFGLLKPEVKLVSKSGQSIFGWIRVSYWYPWYEATVYNNKKKAIYKVKAPACTIHNCAFSLPIEGCDATEY